MLVYTAVITTIFYGERQENIIKKNETHSTFQGCDVWMYNQEPQFL